MHWLSPFWHRLRAGEKLQVSFPVHPSMFGFQQIAFAEQVGQVEDWAQSLNDGSRLHLWLTADGRWIMHRDSVDPSRGPIEALVHGATETNVGKLLLSIGLVLGAGALLRSALE